MQKETSTFKKYILVCEHHREGKPCCAPEGMALREKLKARVKEEGLSSQIRVSRTGCLDICAEGPNVLVMPDNVRYKLVQEEDLEEILKEVKESL